MGGTFSVDQHHIRRLFHEEEILCAGKGLVFAQDSDRIFSYRSLHWTKDS